MRARQQDILNILETRAEVPVSEFARLLGVSEVTIRADLSALERAGRLRRTRGGATRPFARAEQPLEETQHQHAGAKRRIGQAAARLIDAGDTVFLDVGSTTTEIARHIPATLSGVTILTNGLNIALELERLPHLTVIVTGGTLRRLQHALVSPYALDLIERFRPDKAFLGCNGVHAQSGITNHNHQEAEIKARVAQLSRQVIVTTDARKIGTVAPAAITPLKAVHTLITDRSADATHLQALRDTGVHVTLV